MIESSDFTMAIIMMALITFTVRYIFFTRAFQINLPDRVQNILIFTAPCILTAMCIPIMFQSGLEGSNNANTALAQLMNSSYFWGGLLSIVLSFLLRHTLLVIVLSIIGFYGLRQFGLS